MKLIDNINSLLGEDLKATIHPKARIKIAASCFSIYAYEALKSELSKIELLEFIFTAPTFVPDEVTDKIKKERREFYIPKINRERNLYGSEFEIHLRNKLTQRAIARECAEWMLRKTRFRSNKTKAPMQQFACIQGPEQEVAYMPLYGFTAVDLGYQQGDAVSNIVNRIDEPAHASTYLQLFDFDFFELLDSVTIARSRKHIQTFYDTSAIGQFPERRKPLAFHSPLTERPDVMSFNEIFGQLSLLKLAVYAPISYILPSRLKKYEDLYDTLVEGGKGKLKQADRERSLQALMTTNLLKRLESSVEAFRITLQSLHDNHTITLNKIEAFKASGGSETISDWTDGLENLEAEEDDIPVAGDAEIGGKVKINLADMDLPSWEHDLNGDLQIIKALLESMSKVTPEDDAKLQLGNRLVANTEWLSCPENRFIQHGRCKIVDFQWVNYSGFSLDGFNDH
jgi:hypothetical protein